MQLFKELDEFLSCFAKNIHQTMEDGRVISDFLNTIEYNKESIAHSRIHALIAKTGFDLDYAVEVEAGFKPADGNTFYPDVQLWDSDKLKFLIEYESTNSSDSRIVSKDLQHYVQSLQNEIDNCFPEYWLIIYTLPGSSVKDWSRWDYNKGDETHALIRNNPDGFYKPIFEDPRKICNYKRPPKRCPNLSKFPGIHSYVEGENWHKRKLFLINLTTSGAVIDYPKKCKQSYPFIDTTDIA